MTRLPVALTFSRLAVGVALLYPACRWFAGVKQRHKHWALSYL